MKARKVKGLEPAEPLGANAARIIDVRLGELRSLASAALADERNAEEQHDLRIAAKRLRYVLEATGICFGAAGEEALAAARELQGILGDLHDCDEMSPRVERWLVRNGPDRGLEALHIHLAARRKVLFADFRECWDERARTGSWERLTAAAEAL